MNIIMKVLKTLSVFIGIPCNLSALVNTIIKANIRKKTYHTVQMRNFTLKQEGSAVNRSGHNGMEKRENDSTTVDGVLFCLVHPHDSRDLDSFHSFFSDWINLKLCVVALENFALFTKKVTNERECWNM